MVRLAVNQMVGGSSPLPRALLSHSVTGSTTDFESVSLSSNLSGTALATRSSRDLLSVEENTRP